MFTSACAPAGNDFGIRLEAPQSRVTPLGVQVRARQEIRLSREAREALRHGVPLRLAMDLKIRGEGEWRPLGENTFIYEIRYLPLSDHYQLSGPAGVADADAATRTFPRLRHVLAELGDVELSLPHAEPGPGRYEVRLRTRLDRKGMPAPMQLPALLSPNWDHDSGWVSSALEIGG